MATSRVKVEANLDEDLESAHLEVKQGTVTKVFRMEAKVENTFITIWMTADQCLDLASQLVGAVQRDLHRAAANG